MYSDVVANFGWKSFYSNVLKLQTLLHTPKNSFFSEENNLYTICIRTNCCFKAFIILPNVINCLGLEKTRK